MFCRRFSVFFIYFLSFFHGRHNDPRNHRTTGLIFTKFIGLVELWKGLIMRESVWRSLNVRSYGNQFYMQNRPYWPTYLNLSCWRFEFSKRIGISERDEQVRKAINCHSSCTNLVRFGAVTPKFICLICVQQASISAGDGVSITAFARWRQW